MAKQPIKKATKKAVKKGESDSRVTPTIVNNPVPPAKKIRKAN